MTLHQIFEALTREQSAPQIFRAQTGRLEKTGDERMGQVSIQAAFDSPDTLANATEYLRQYAQDSGSQAAVAVVPKHKIAYPQVPPPPFLPSLMFPPRESQCPAPTQVSVINCATFITTSDLYDCLSVHSYARTLSSCVKSATERKRPPAIPAGVAEVGVATREDGRHFRATGGAWHPQGLVCAPGAEGQVGSLFRYMLPPEVS